MIKAILRVRFFIYRTELTINVSLRHRITRTEPDLAFRKTTDISPEILKRMGIKGLILDVDNTLATHDDPVPAAGVVEWLENMKKNGIKLTIVSNNRAERVRPFADPLGLDFVSKGGKPLKKGYVEAMKRMGLKPSETAAVGDQLFTDIWGAKNAGITAIFVRPIKPEGKAQRFIRFKRVLEKPFLPKKFVGDRKD